MRRTLRRLAGIAAVGALVLAGCSSSSKDAEGDQRPGGTLRMAVVGLTSVDPAAVVPTVQGEMVAADMIADGLTSIDAADREAVPALAQEWKVDDAGTTWRFTLREDARFADGSTVTASDVIASLERVAKLGSSSLAGARLDVVAGYPEWVAGSATGLAGLRAPDDRTVEITTAAPDAELPLLLGSPLFGVTKPAATDDAGSSSDSTASTAPGGTAPAAPVGSSLVGSGPFRVESDDGTTVRLVRTDGSPAQLAEVDLLRVADPYAALQAVKDGQADWASVPANARASLGEGDLQVDSSPLGAVDFFGMNLASPTFANPLFRQAIIKAIDRATVVKTTLPGLDPITAVVPPGVAGATTNPCGDGCTYDQGVAKLLLAQAFPDGRVPIVEIDVSDDPSDVPVANAIRDQLFFAGIPSAVKTLPFAEYQKFVTTGQQQLFRTGWVGLTPSAGGYLGPLFKTGSADNLVSFTVADVDTQLTAAYAEKDATKRAAKFGEIEKAIFGYFPVVPLGSFTATVVLSPGVRDYAPRLDGSFDVVKLSIGEPPADAAPDTTGVSDTTGGGTGTTGGGTGTTG